MIKYVPWSLVWVCVSECESIMFVAWFMFEAKDGRRLFLFSGETSHPACNLSVGLVCSWSGVERLVRRDVVLSVPSQVHSATKLSIFLGKDDISVELSHKHIRGDA